MSDDSDAGPTVPVVCSECGTTTRVPLDDLAETVDRHNEQVHDGESVAEVDPDVKASLVDLIADELGVTEWE